MIYSILIYGSEERVAGMTAEEEAEVMGRHKQLRADLSAEGRLGPVLRLSPEGTRTVRRYKERSYITDGPFAETKEQLMGIYVVECATIDDAVAAAERLDFDTGLFVIRPVTFIEPGALTALTPPT